MLVQQSNCKYHGLTDFVKRVCKGRKDTWDCKKCRVDSVMRRRYKIKRDLVELFGGCCELCGYNKCLRALEFHHIDPTTKSFTLCLKTVVGWNRIKEEARKCQLLCSNCHAEVEDKLFKQSKGSSTLAEHTLDRRTVVGSTPTPSTTTKW